MKALGARVRNREPSERRLLTRFHGTAKSVVA